MTLSRLHDTTVSHPFVERPIGTIRREYLDRTLFWTTADLENTIFVFADYRLENRCVRHERSGLHRA
jgi:hypothetical protein